MQLKRKKPNFIPLALLAGAALCIYGFAQYMNYREGQPVERAEPTKYWNCILEKLPGTQSDVIAYQSVNMCFSQFGGGQDVGPRDKVGGLFSVPRAGECIERFGKQTGSYVAAQLIVAACNQLYVQ
ncbi:hypothetical protein BCO37747_07478 [Burkholderia contaminans]|uniref:Uncharacterized protein n=2 Tax=Burkholderia cepacia complex TaxID=87882 RepID=A0A6J5JTC8_9BURK|nr:hypothetical protein [Burkholderia contaminans]KKL36316.1 hypothetical protein WR31_24190 [Burkholderia contaminans LMG 23361]ONU46899.1 hypothetical protein A8E62_33180 [Burkholderia cenocepacia]CAB3974650.1 hypothetical protein BLA3211_08130 [Burkholderia aenigmatica]MBA9834791.1 hypothetical protein [Burkholderia contaminans]MBA9842740.1 hypothetical protein [Burkholderia contaminans]